jgi:predicted dithiol-disulfide oxidoreductase (DUF899 family)
MKSILSLTLIAAMSIGLAGCAGPRANIRHADVTFGAISRNPTPELRTLNERPSDVQRNLAVNHNQEWRMFHSDLGRVFMTDHPSRLTPHPVVSTTGNPR